MVKEAALKATRSKFSRAVETYILVMRGKICEPKGGMQPGTTPASVISYSGEAKRYSFISGNAVRSFVLSIV